jgi:hypothetical protein
MKLPLAVKAKTRTKDEQFDKDSSSTILLKKISNLMAAENVETEKVQKVSQ